VTFGIEIDPAAATPIWSQIEEAVRRQVASGRLAPGAAAPSVRALAGALLVNPATVAKAYQRLVDAGVLAVRRGEGTYVAERPPPMARAERTRLLRDAAERYVAAARLLGAGDGETLSALEAALSGGARAAQGGKR
jgi:GntR family transcriptional regulator